MLIAAPGRPRAAAFPVQELRPGAAMGAGLSSGALNVAAVGTVAYVDGDRVWAFGHPFDGAGRRSLFLQDAYVYTVINNPVGIEGVSTYKLAVPGHDVGVLSGDGLSSVAGRLGVMPKRFPMRVIANDGDTRHAPRPAPRHRRRERPRPADGDLGARARRRRGDDAGGDDRARRRSRRGRAARCARRSGSSAYKPPLEFCNRYVTRDGGISADGGLGAGGPMVADFVEAIALHRRASSSPRSTCDRASRST